MSVFRIEKNRNYTVMSNHHLRNKELSLKSKGLLSLMLSLPEEWDYTLKGLSIICKEGIDAIRVSIVELEKQGYIERRRNRNTKGQLTNTEYIIHEYPITVTPKSEKPMLEKPTLENPILDNPMLEKPTLENPILDNPTQEKPTLENPTQINKDKTIKEKINTDCIKYQSINPSEQTNPDERLIERYNKTKSEIKKQIDYDTLILSNNEDIINDIVEVMTDVMVVDTKYYVIGKKEIPAELVKIRYKQLNYGKIEALMLDLNDVTHIIRSKTPYLISALYNAANTGETSMSNRVRRDMYRI